MDGAIVGWLRQVQSIFINENGRYVNAGLRRVSTCDAHQNQKSADTAQWEWDARKWAFIARAEFQI